MRDRRGFTLIEMVVAVGLASFVLVGVVLIAATALRYHFEGIRKGEVTTSTLYGIDQMRRDFDATTHLEWNSPATTGSDIVRGCVNWSKGLNPPNGSQVDPNVAATAPWTYWYVYCIDNSVARPMLRRIWGDGCPTGNPVHPFLTIPTDSSACSNNYSFTIDNQIVISGWEGFYKMDGNPWYFYRNDFKGGVEADFIVGISTPSDLWTPSNPRNPVPVAYKIQSGMAVNRSYNSPLCSGNPCD